ncbi:MAG: hypothetical protein OEY20_08455 [Gemmatimonadota bacterium]|nr:hypothetical protein [Gemmatimonadota bacterium]MDH4349623.1 hypothetical protein [Gemmatimonadota bacterium]MDH5197268.1 hypothetical protein [Gemmatimonadota bacterium]
MLTQTPAPTPPEIPDWLFQRGPDPIDIAIAVVIVISSLGAVSMLWMLVRGWMRKWSQPAVGQDVVETLKHSVQQLSAEVGELHERMDFAERMLAAQREPQRLEGRGS